MFDRTAYKSSTIIAFSPLQRLDTRFLRLGRNHVWSETNAAGDSSPGSDRDGWPCHPKPFASDLLNLTRAVTRLNVQEELRERDTCGEEHTHENRLSLPSRHRREVSRGQEKWFSLGLRCLFTCTMRHSPKAVDNKCR
jgi:hypothetical protein